MTSSQFNSQVPLNVNSSSSGKEMQKSNTTDSSEIPGSHFQPETDIPSILIALLIVILNGCVLYLVKQKHSLRTVTNLFLASLAMSDFLTGLYMIPTYLVCKATENNSVCQASAPLFTFTSLSTVTHLSIVTVERYIAIVLALRHQALVTKFRAKLVIVTIWVMAMALSLIQLEWAPPDDLDVLEFGTEHFKNSEVAFSIFIIVIVLLPFPFLAYSYFRIFTEVRRHNNSIKRTTNLVNNSQPKTHELRTVLMFALMLLTYTFCWLPNALIRYQYSTDAFMLPEWAESLIIFLRFLTSFINPCFCLFFKRDFRKCLAMRLRSRGQHDSGPRRSKLTEFELHTTSPATHPRMASTAPFIR